MSHVYTSRGAAISVPEVPAHLTRRAIVAGNVGNVIEWYDFGLYGFLATIIASKFFPSGDPTAAVLATFGVYASAFAIRPLGGAVWGRLGDTWGRKRVLMATVVTMSAGTLLIGILPTYGAIGIAAPIILVIARLVQGFGAAGEYSSATAFVIEYGDPRRRAWRAGFIAAGAFAGIPLATGISAVVSALSPGSFFEDYGWRIPFLLAVPFAGIAMYIRTRLEDTPEFRAVKDMQMHVEGRATPLREVVSEQWRAMLVFFCVVITYTVSAFMLTGFFPTYLIDHVGLSNEETYVASTVSLIVLTVSCIPAGWLADRIGRKPLLVTGYTYFFVMMIPIFLIISIGGLVAAIVAELLVVVGLFFLLTPMTVTMAEMFPTDVRAAASGVSYNLATAVFGGTAPLVATALIAITGRQLSVPIYVMAVAVVSFVVVVLAFARTRHQGPGARLAEDAGSPAGETSSPPPADSSPL